MNEKTARIYEFGPFRIDASERQLLHDGQVIPLSPKVFETLLVLVENGGRVVKKDDLIGAVWPDSFVEEGSLVQNVSLIRKALGDRQGEQQFIETVPKLGYRFIAPVKMLSTATEEAEAGRLIVSEPSASKVVIERGDQVEEGERGGWREEPLTSSPASRSHDGWRMNLWSLALGLALLLGLAGAVFVWRSGARKVAPAASANSINDIHSVAILPLTAVGIESDDEHLGVGMADALIVKLSGFRQLKVLPTSTVYRYAEGEQDALAVGRELGVEAVLVGTVQREGDRIRVTLMLVNVNDGHTLWSESFDERWRDIFILQDSISERVAEALSLRLSLDEKKLLAKRYTENPEAYQSYLTGIYFKNKRTKEGLYKSVDYFRQAVARDPNYALAYAAMADSESLIAYYRYNAQPPDELYQQAKALATKALELDSTLAEAYVALGMVSMNYENDRKRGIELFQKALDINPNYVDVQIRCAWVALSSLDFEKAQQGMKKAQELDPVSPLTNGSLGQLLYLLGDYDGAIKFSRKALELEPGDFIPHCVLALAYEQKGMYEEALEEVKGARDAAKNVAEATYTEGVKGYTYAMMGRKQEALKILGELQQAQKANPDDVSSLDSALIYDALGERDKALSLISVAFEKEPGLPATFTFDPRLERLRADPRYEELLTRRLARRAQR